MKIGRFEIVFHREWAGISILDGREVRKGVNRKHPGGPRAYYMRGPWEAVWHLKGKTA